jgi:hypothetical protein
MSAWLFMGLMLLAVLSLPAAVACAIFFYRTGTAYLGWFGYSLILLISAIVAYLLGLLLGIDLACVHYPSGNLCGLFGFLASGPLASSLAIVLASSLMTVRGVGVGMIESATAGKKRSWIIWAIALYLLYAGIGAILTPLILHSGLAVPSSLTVYAERMSTFDYLLFFLVGGLCIYGAVALLRFQKIARYLLPIGGTARTVLNLWADLEVGSIPPISLVILFVTALLALGVWWLLFMYLSRLTNKGILS